jgi:hypothetical protein
MKLKICVFKINKKKAYNAYNKIRNCMMKYKRYNNSQNKKTYNVG